jgi:hypothetical protein
LWKGLYEENKELLDLFGKLALELGRMPVPGEFGRLDEVGERLGSAKRGLRAFIQGGGAGGIDWAEIKERFGIGAPVRRRWEILCEEHKELLDAFWTLTLQLGRVPEPEEFPRFAEVREKIGSANRAMRLFVLRGGGDEIQKAAEGRCRDLLVYVALANLRKRVPFGHLSMSLRSDIRTFFGNYTRALEKGLELLYAAGDTGEIELAYVGCATSLFGDVAQADVIKLHKTSGKVTFLVYDDFEGKALPELRQRIKVNMRTRWVQVFDHSAEGQLLYFRERFVSSGDPKRREMEAFSVKLRKLGICPGNGFEPRRGEFLDLVHRNGLNERLNRVRLPAEPQ